MLRHQKESEQAYLYPTTPPAPEQAIAETIPAIEIYLDRVYVPSLGPIDETERALLRDGMRDHLVKAVRLREARGLTRQYAIADTLRDVDAALKEVEEQQTRAVSNVKLTTGFDLRDAGKAAVLFGIPYALDATGVSGGLWDRYVNDHPDLFYGLELFAIPVVAGLITGAIARKSGPRAVIGGLVALAVMGFILPSMVLQAGVSIQNPADWVAVISRFADVAGVGVAWWTLLGCLGAFAGQRLIKRRRAHIQRRFNRQKFAAGLCSVFSRDNAIAFTAYAVPVAFLAFTHGPLSLLRNALSNETSGAALFAVIAGFPFASGALTALAVRKNPVLTGLRAVAALGVLFILGPSLVEAFRVVSEPHPALAGFIEQIAAGILGWWAIAGSLGALAGRVVRGGKSGGRSIASALNAFRHGKSGAVRSAFAPGRKDHERILLSPSRPL